METGTAVSNLSIRNFACLVRKRPSFDMTKPIPHKSTRTNRFNVLQMVNEKMNVGR